MLLKAFIFCWLGTLLTFGLFAQESLPPPVIEVYSPTITWCPVSGATGYNIYMGTKAKTYDAPVVLSPVTQHEVRALGPGTYYFVVKAFNLYAESDPSNEVSITILPSSAPPPQITQMMVSAITASSVTISWVTNADCNGTIFYGTDPIRWLSYKANNLGTTDHLGVIPGLLPRTHYFYKAQSVCGEKTIESEIRSFNTK